MRDPLTSHSNQRLTPQGEHPINLCKNWQKKKVVEVEWCPEVAS